MTRQVIMVYELGDVMYEDLMKLPRLAFAEQFRGSSLNFDTGLPDSQYLYLDEAEMKFIIVHEWDEKVHLGVTVLKVTPKAQALTDTEIGE